MKSPSLTWPPTQSNGPEMMAVGTRVGKQTMGTFATDTAHFGASQTAREMRDWFPRVGSADSELLPELDTLRARNRDLERNNGTLAGGIQTHLDNIIGPTFRLQAKPNFRVLGWDPQKAREWARNTEAHFKDFAECKLFSADGKSDFLGSSNLVLRSAMISGDGAAIPRWLPKRVGTDWATAVQIIEADRISNPNGRPDTDTLRAGIRTNKFGEAQTYYIQRAHPGDELTTGVEANTWIPIRAKTRFGRSKFIFVTDQHRPGQTRNKPLASAVMAAFRLQGEYQLAETQAALVNAKVAAFIESNMSPEDVMSLFGGSEDPAKAYVQAYNQWRGKLDSGAIVQLPVGAKFEGFTPSRPATAFAPFMQELGNEIATGINLPGILLNKDFSKVNFSSARAALLEAWRHFHSRRKWFASQWANEIYALWLEEAVNRGIIDAPNFYQFKSAYCRAEWLGVGHLPIDPTKTANANKVLLESKQTTYAKIFAEQGLDWEEEFEQIKAEQEYAQNNGIELSTSNGGFAPDTPDEPPPGNNKPDDEEAA